MLSNSTTRRAFLRFDTTRLPRARTMTSTWMAIRELMEEQRVRARAAQKKEVIELSQIETKEPTHFLGYDHGHTGADVQEVVVLKDKTAVVLNNSVCYAEMGGQVGDTGELVGSGKLWRVVNTQHTGNTWLHFIDGEDAPAIGEHVTVAFENTSSPSDRAPPHCDACPALGAARNCFARSRAEGELCRPGQVDVRFFERGADGGAKARRRETRE